MLVVFFRFQQMLDKRKFDHETKLADEAAAAESAKATSEASPNTTNIQNAQSKCIYMYYVY